MSNSAGGAGWYSQPVPAYLLATSGVGQFERYREDIEKSKGRDLFSLGIVKLHSCHIQKPSEDAFGGIAYSASWLIVAASRSVVLDYSRFDAHEDQHLGLLSALEQSEALISGCMVTNLDVCSLGLLGVVNSSFEPALNATIALNIKPPKCDIHALPARRFATRGLAVKRDRAVGCSAIAVATAWKPSLAWYQMGVNAPSPS